MRTRRVGVTHATSFVQVPTLHVSLGGVCTLEWTGSVTPPSCGVADDSSAVRYGASRGPDADLETRTRRLSAPRNPIYQG